MLARPIPAQRYSDSVTSELSHLTAKPLARASFVTSIDESERIAREPKVVEAKLTQRAMVHGRNPSEILLAVRAQDPVVPRKRRASLEQARRSHAVDRRVLDVELSGRLHVSRDEPVVGYIGL